MKKLAFILSLFAAILCGCSDKPESMLTFHTGTTSMIGDSLSLEDIAMPETGFHVAIKKDFFMYSGDITGVQVAEVVMPDGVKQRGFYFLCDSRGKRRLFSATASNIGGYVVVKRDGTPIGIRQIDVAIVDGKIFMIPEIPDDEDIFKMAEKLNEEIKKVNEFKDSLY